MLDDTFYLQNASWISSGGPISWLWSYKDLDVFQAYSSLTLPASEVVVAVIDTGVDYDHEDLAGRLWVNAGESDAAKYNNGVDDDGDGFVDDFLGWDFANHVNNPIDDAGHGTHVAGTIAATGGNGRGIVGVAPWVRIMSLKVCDSAGECESGDIRAAMSYAVEHGAKVINLSLGAFDTGSDALAFEQAVREATEAGSLVVAAAGNSSIDASNMTPASATYAVAVAAHRNDGQKCSWTDNGFKIDLSAPGCGFDGDVEVSGILSLNSHKCGFSFNQPCQTRKTVGGGAYALKAGTSMSTPHVSGMAAVAWTASPDATPLQIRQALLQTARKAAPGNVNATFGMGRVYGANLVQEARTAPGVKIVSPRYGSTSDTHDLGIRIEARDRAVSWTLRYVAYSGAPDVDLSSGTTIDSGSQSVGVGEYVTLSRTWSPPAPGEYLVVLEADAAGEKYYDVTLLNR
ncbi:MAG: S8 family serine peptidase [Deltaproteobacteria bacterium]|nr:S8 family serine peptidase [Deltaproteobacteria bacterium]